MKPAPAGWLVPDWPAPDRVRAFCTTRGGGVSLPPWDSLNLGTHVGDDAAAVARNRSALETALGARCVFLSQVHGNAVLEIGAETADGPSADGSVTSERGVACTILVADCLPVLLCDEAGTRVAAAHAGWRGLAGGVLDEVLRHFEASSPVRGSFSASETIAWLGPCIGPAEFEVGADVRHAFEAVLSGSGRCFEPCAADKWLADLAGLARLALRRAGVERIFGNDGSDRWCTLRNASRFFSHRRDARRLGASGRFAAGVWLD